MSLIKSCIEMSKMQKPPDTVTRLKNLYPAVCDLDVTLPLSWSVKEKHSYIGLSNNELRAHYKGVGKTHKDAASVRSNKCIPTSCGIYYFEVKIISKGRDGYMGIGLSAHGVNMNRLPGWDKFSWGYHGDDGHSFCSKGSGEPYGPTFTTNDVIGCCINLVEDTCFYTKNGISLGIAFRDLPHNLYPTIGLQTPGEVIEANFGQLPFVYDIHDYILEWKTKTKMTLDNFPISEKIGEWQQMLQKVVSSYLVHHGYYNTAECFGRSTNECISEEIASIKNRQKIQSLVLSGDLEKAISLVQDLYPSLLQQFPDLLFTLKCRQFIEMVNEINTLNSEQHKASETNGVIRLDDIAMEVSEDEEDEEINTACKKKKELSNKKSCGGDAVAIQNMLEFGRKLHILVDSDLNFKNRKANKESLHKAFSLLAYSDPWNSPLGSLMESSEREPLSSTLNSIILESQGLPKKPPLELVLGQAKACMKLMAKSNIALSAFASIDISVGN